MKRRKSSPPEDTATEESTRDRVSMAARRLLLRPWMVSPADKQRCTVRTPPTRASLRGDQGQSGIPGAGVGEAGPTSVLLKEAQERADGGHGRGDIGVVPQLRPEGLDQVCKERGTSGTSFALSWPALPAPRSRYRPCSWSLRSVPLPPRRRAWAWRRPTDGTRWGDGTPCRGVISRRREQLVPRPEL